MSNFIRNEDIYRTGCAGCGNTTDITGYALKNYTFFYCKKCTKKEQESKEIMRLMRNK